MLSDGADWRLILEPWRLTLYLLTMTVSSGADWRLILEPWRLTLYLLKMTVEHWS
jgi:hypothetical protein